MDHSILLSPPFLISSVQPPRFSSLITFLNSLSWQLRQLWEPQQAESTGDSGQRGSLSRAVVGDPWTPYPPGTASLFQKMVMILTSEMHVWWCLWRLRRTCQVVPNSWVQFVSGPPLKVLPGSIQPLKGRHESLTLFSALS